MFSGQSEAEQASATPGRHAQDPGAASTRENEAWGDGVYSSPMCVTAPSATAPGEGGGSGLLGSQGED